MKRTTLLLALLFSFVACDNKEESNSNTKLTNTMWKLASFVNIAEGTTKTPKPDGYWIYFNEDKTLTGRSSTNKLFGKYEIDYNSSSIKIINLGGTEINEIFDGYFYIESLMSVSCFFVSEKELRLYYNGNSNYLLFKPMNTILENTEFCGRIEIGKDEYMIMKVFPETVTTNSLNKLIIENHTKIDASYGTFFSLEHFNGEKWIPIKLDLMWHDILINLFSGETNEEEINLYSLIERNNNSKKGRYRITKDFTFSNTGNYNVCAEFEIQ